MSDSSGMPVESARLSWQQRLTSITHFYSKQETEDFLDRLVRPALENVAAHMSESGHVPELTGGNDRLSLVIPHGELDSFQRSEEHTSEIQSLMRISYAVFCLKKKI